MCMLEQILIFVEVFKEFRTASVIAAIWNTRSDYVAWTIVQLRTCHRTVTWHGGPQQRRCPHD